MKRPITSRTMTSANQAVIWQPYIDHCGQEPAILVQRDATGLLVITQEGRDVLVQPETLHELIKQLKRLAVDELQLPSPAAGPGEQHANQ